MDGRRTTHDDEAATAAFFLYSLSQSKLEKTQGNGKKGLIQCITGILAASSSDKAFYKQTWFHDV